MCLTACATPSTPVIEYRTERVTPPAALTTPCDTDNRPITTNGDLAEAVVTTREQRDTCAAKVDALRDWSAGTTIDQ